MTSTAFWLRCTRSHRELRTRRSPDTVTVQPGHLGVDDAVQGERADVAERPPA
jgi:hypothetical protein